MFQITNETFRFRKRHLISRTGPIDLQLTQKHNTTSHKYYIKPQTANNNLFNHYSTPKNIKVLPKLNNPVLYPTIENRYHRFFKGDESQSQSKSTQKLSMQLKIDSEDGRAMYFRSEKKHKGGIIVNQLQKQLDSTAMTSTADRSKICNPQPQFFVMNKKGKRPYNQDRYICRNNLNKFYKKNNNLGNIQEYSDPLHLYSVFDGHGGSVCADYLKDNFVNFLLRSTQLQVQPEIALKQAFETSEQKFLQLCQNKKAFVQTSGSCAVACLIAKDKIYAANVGDSRALMFNKDYLCEMTKDHKPTETTQKMRIIKSGGKIYKEQSKPLRNLNTSIKTFNTTRIAPGNLNVSRTIGDIEVKLKKYGGLPGMVSPQPEIKVFEKQNYQILLLASDGLFEAFTNQQIKQFYYKLASNLSAERRVSTNIVKRFIQNLCQQAEKKSTDNITIIVVDLREKEKRN